jgi:cytochrome c peroxidase
VLIRLLPVLLLLQMLAPGEPSPSPRRVRADAAPAADAQRAALRQLVAANASATADADLVLVRIQAAWCGPCQWHAGWSQALADAFPRRLAIIDLLRADEDNQPATAEAVQAWQAKTGRGVTTVAVAAEDDSVRVLLAAPSAQATTGTAAAPSSAAAAAAAAGSAAGGATAAVTAALLPPLALPRVLLVDRRELSIRATASNPAPDTVLALVRRELARIDGSALSPETPQSPLFDGRFTRDQWDLIRDMRLPDAPPPDPTNRVADDSAAAAFGRRLFFDQTLSPAGRSCSSCHAPDLLFTNGKDIASEGVGPGVRNVPSIIVASSARWLMWDGRVDSLWAQAVMPFEDPTEMGSSRLFVAHAVRARHAAAYEALFGPLPALDERDRFPERGKPDDAQWTAMRPSDREAVSRLMANVGKSIAAFERSLRVQPNALDRYAAGEMTALTADEKDGLAAFLQAGCAQCHHGPRLTDDAFHVLRFPTGHDDGTADRGRIDGIPRLLADEFSRDGLFSDARLPARRPATTATAATSALGAFRTPSLRGVPFTMPYGHCGGFGGLTSVIDAHRTGGLSPASRYAVGETEPWAQGFDPALTPKIARFLRVLRMDLTSAEPRASAPASDQTVPARAGQTPPD